MRLQADKMLGRSYAGLLPFVEGLYHMGYLNREVYEQRARKYSDKLIGKKQFTLLEMQEMEKNAQLARLFQAVADQWASLKPAQREAHLKKAYEVRRTVKQAELIIQLGEQGK